MSKQQQQKQKQQQQASSSTFIQYDGMNGFVNSRVLLRLKHVMLECDQVWHDTFFTAKTDLPYLDWAGLEVILNFYKPFRTGELSFQINENEWHKKADIDLKCRQQMTDYTSEENTVVGATRNNDTPNEVLADKLFNQLLNQIYNKMKGSGGFYPTVVIGDFRKDKNKGSELIWTKDDIDWEAYHSRLNEVKSINKIEAERFGKFYSFLKKNGLI